MTIDRIVAASLALIDRDGLSALTMRNLATELSTGTTTLYRHVGSKDEIGALVVDEIVGEADLGPSEAFAGWRNVIEEMARSLRRSLVGHPHALPLFVESVPVGPHALRARNQVLELLREHGLSSDLAADLLIAVLHHVLGSALLNPMADFPADGPQRSRTLSLRDFYRGLPSEDFPRLIESADRLTRNPPAGEFEFGLRLLLDGVELRLAGGGAAGLVERT
ncbi:TetR/AcrR family transcriptional regulator [Aquihabitans sp. McL0605]|uniref:TetR/AcrR family transcriptional regulator n=1 Tax=Aquihabitans sp. McL0605 TaxID=3415671 RepID=UPI003CEB7973